MPNYPVHTASNHQPSHPWPTGHIFESHGAHLTYRVIGPCCRLYDREQLPWPCCRIQWHSKEPSWRRIGRRFIPDLATRTRPSYCVEIVGQSYRSEPVVMTLYTEKLSTELKNWWHTKRLSTLKATAASTFYSLDNAKNHAEASEFKAQLSQSSPPLVQTEPNQIVQTLATSALK